MKQRVITGVVAIAAFIPLLFFLPPVWMTAVMAVFCAIGAYELLVATKSVAKATHPFVIASCLCAAAMPFAAGHSDGKLWQVMTVAFFYMLAVFACGVFDHTRISYETMAKGFLAALVLPLLFSAVVRILNLPQGRYLVLMPWVTVWVCDSAALFVGKTFGKRKMAPYVSPKKTIAGGIGGQVGGLVAMAMYVLVLKTCFDVSFPLTTALIFGFFGAAAGQLGDLSLSVIKRGCGIKDYGKVFPGHGGVWDRFDSILFAAPMFEIIVVHWMGITI